MPHRIAYVASLHLPFKNKPGGLLAFSYSSKQPFDTGLRHALAAQSLQHAGAGVALPNTPFKTSRVDSWPALVDLSNALTLA